MLRCFGCRAGCIDAGLLCCQQQQRAGKAKHQLQVGKERAAFGERGGGLGLLLLGQMAWDGMDDL